MEGLPASSRSSARIPFRDAQEPETVCESVGRRICLSPSIRAPTASRLDPLGASGFARESYAAIGSRHTLSEISHISILLFARIVQPPRPGPYIYTPHTTWVVHHKGIHPILCIPIHSLPAALKTNTCLLRHPVNSNTRTRVRSGTSYRIA